MNIHQNARLTPIRREEMARSVIEGHLSTAQAAREFGVCAKIAGRWTTRFRAEGRAGMQDRSSRPKAIPTQTAQPLAERIITLRRQRPKRAVHCRADGRLLCDGQPRPEAGWPDLF